MKMSPQQQKVTLPPIKNIFQGLLHPNEQNRKTSTEGGTTAAVEAAISLQKLSASSFSSAGHLSHQHQQNHHPYFFHQRAHRRTVSASVEMPMTYPATQSSNGSSYSTLFHPYRPGHPHAQHNSAAGNVMQQNGNSYHTCQCRGEHHTKDAEYSASHQLQQQHQFLSAHQHHHYQHQPQQSFQQVHSRPTAASTAVPSACCSSSHDHQSYRSRRARAHTTSGYPPTLLHYPSPFGMPAYSEHPPLHGYQQRERPTHYLPSPEKPIFPPPSTVSGNGSDCRQEKPSPATTVTTKTKGHPQPKNQQQQQQKQQQKPTPSNSTKTMTNSTINSLFTHTTTINNSSSTHRYHCQHCRKSFSRPSSLRIHIYSHTGEKPFRCHYPGCGRSFSVHSNMRRHLRVHYYYNNNNNNNNGNGAATKTESTTSITTVTTAANNSKSQTEAEGEEDEDMLKLSMRVPLMPIPSIRTSEDEVEEDIKETEKDDTTTTATANHSTALTARVIC